VKNGVLIVIPGSKSGLWGADHRIVGQSTGSVPAASETGDRFGVHCSSAVLDRDGCAGLVVSPPARPVSAEGRGGAVVWLNMGCAIRFRSHAGDRRGQTS
jgi:hypothetical protein